MTSTPTDKIENLGLEFDNRLNNDKNIYSLPTIYITSYSHTNTAKLLYIELLIEEFRQALQTYTYNKIGWQLLIPSTINYTTTNYLPYIYLITTLLYFFLL